MHKTPHGGNAAQRVPANRNTRRLGVAGLAILAGSVTTAAVLAPLAGATTGHAASRPSKSSKAKTSTKKKSTGSSLLKQDESKLTALEKGAPSGVTLSETGSTLFYPLFQEWQAVKPLGIAVSPTGTGSGTGQSSALNGTVNIGASDAYLPSTDPATLLNIPIVVSAQQINYNLPGFKPSFHLRLNATILNGIYTGKITNWDNSQIAKINKGTKLPNLAIVPLRRSDGSGDTFIFTSYIDYQAPGGGFVQPDMGGPNTSSTSFPSVPAEQAENGNSGMLSACEKIKGCIAYIGISYRREALASGLGDAALLNGYKKGPQYVVLDPSSIQAEVASYSKIPASGTLSLVDSKSAKGGYPIVNFEYAIVNENQSSSTTAAAIKAFLAWGADPRGGAQSKYLASIGFQPLAANALAVTLPLLQKIGG